MVKLGGGGGAGERGPRRSEVSLISESSEADAGSEEETVHGCHLVCITEEATS